MLFSRIASALALLVACVATARAEHPVTTAPAILSRVVPLVEKACGAKFAKAPIVRELTVPEAMALFAKDVRPELEQANRGAHPRGALLVAVRPLEPAARPTPVGRRPDRTLCFVSVP